jgi:hypothetical protein
MVLKPSRLWGVMAMGVMYMYRDYQSPWDYHTV